MNKKLKVLITGPIPPPAGGISIHIGRLQNLLKDEFEFDLIDEGKSFKKGVYNIRSLNPFPYFKKMAWANVVFVHSGSTYFRAFQLLVSKFFRKKTLLTIHAYPYKKKSLYYHFDNFIFNFADKIIVVNEDILPRLSLPPEKCIIKNAFLPPVLKNEPELPDSIMEIIKNSKAKSKIIISSNAFRLDKYNGEDLYGLDMCIAATSRLLKKGYDICFVFIVASINYEKDRFDEGLKQIKELQIQDSFFLINQPVSFVKLIQQSDIIVRPTNTDGDALSIREAICLGKPILSSDIVVRPKETILFKNRDLDDFEAKLQQLIAQHKNIGNIIDNDDRTLSNEYMAFYTNLIQNLVSN